MSAKSAVVTGAAQGIGKAIAIRLAADGCNVVVSDLASQKGLLDDVVSKITAAGGKAHVVIADVTSEDEVENLVKATIEKYGSLDIMIANAGVAVLTPILDTSVEEWTRVFDVNVKGTMLCYKAAAKAMIEQGRGGRIIGACSLAGKKSAAMCSTYGSSKFAVRALTQVASCEFGKYGITVNGYAPGATETPLLDAMDIRVGDLMQAGPGVYKELMKTQATLGRMAKPEEIASVVSFLASDGSAFMTGQTLVVDGGIWFD